MYAYHMSTPRRRHARAAVDVPWLPTGFLFWRTMLAWQRAVTETLHPFRLTHAQFVLLATLWLVAERTDERPTQGTLARAAGTDPMMTSQVIRALERRGLVRRADDPADARAWRLAVTSRGEALVRRAQPAVEATDSAFFASADDPDALRAALLALATTPPGRTDG